jgi:hypothetical protein
LKGGGLYYVIKGEEVITFTQPTTISEEGRAMTKNRKQHIERLKNLKIRDISKYHSTYSSWISPYSGEYSVGE